jgi:HEAT repeat protein
VGALIVGVAIVGALLWAARLVRDRVDPVRRLTRQLRDGTVEERLKAARMLGGRSASDHIVDAFPALMAAIGDADVEVAVTAAINLGLAVPEASKSGDLPAARTAVAALMAALKDPRPRVREGAAYGLGAAGPGLGPLGTDTTATITGALVATLNDPFDEAGRVAAEALAKVGKVDPPPEGLLAAVESNSSARVRAAAAESLGEFRSGHDRTTLALLHALGKDGPGVRTACDSALRRLHDRRDAKEERRSAAIVPALIEALASREVMVRYHAAATLGEIGAGAGASVPALLRVLSEPPDPEMVGTTRLDPGRWDPAGQAAVALGEIAPGTPQAGEVVAALISAIRGPTLDRSRATAAGGLHGAALDWRRAMALGALARFGPDQSAPAVPVLLDLLKETAGKDGPPAPSVCAAIGQAAPGTPLADRAVEALSAALDSSWEYTRAEAASALAKFGPRASRALPRLLALEKADRTGSVRKAAASAARRIEGTSDTGAPG